MTAVREDDDPFFYLYVPGQSDASEAAFSDAYLQKMLNVSRQIEDRSRSCATDVFAKHPEVYRHIVGALTPLIGATSEKRSQSPLAKEVGDWVGTLPRFSFGNIFAVLVWWPFACWPNAEVAMSSLRYLFSVLDGFSPEYQDLFLKGRFQQVHPPSPPKGSMAVVVCHGHALAGSQ